MRFRIERMTDCEYRNLNIYYGFYSTPVGEILIASTVRGICCIELADDRDEALQLLFERFAKSFQRMCHTEYHDWALRFFSKNGRQSSDEIVLHLYGTDFQIEVWRALLDVPFGETSTYSDIAKAIDNSRALRAVGTAIGRNPVAILVPCHRILRSDGGIGGYYWGIEKKKILLEWEKY
ncbi:methylated-DNA--[protein]-cysteine S-methyltransferase [uncultured Bacteroides sp.]|uniref:methylated-DNA--[protein]-cysteine S-methyltransferase n=1 Tax=uncultured Bacteroides sp. TaxID=162156 RepID=UPI002625CEBA|nr:methylated-DNA--[protein]-cysteine S-methyltransferase [uncultured Bacteroides sp.]